jgi:hypothetical protein
VKLLRAVLAAALCLVAGTAAADPVAWPSTSTPVTITTHAVFQQVAPSALTRHGCYYQNTSSDTEYVYFGSTASATTAGSAKLSPGSAITCAAGPTVASDAIQVTSAATDGATGVLVTQ